MLWNAVPFAILPANQERDALNPWTFFTTNYAILAFAGNLLWSLHYRRITFAPDWKLFFGLEIIIFCIITVMILGILLRKRQRQDLRHTYLRLVRALLYLLGGPAALYGLVSIYLGVLILLFASKFESDAMRYVSVIVAICLLFAAGVIPVIYATRVARALFRAPALLIGTFTAVVWFASVAFIGIPLNSISEGNISDQEHDMLEDLGVASLAEAYYVLANGQCGNLEELKAYAHNNYEPFGGLALVWARVTSAEFREEMHGYRIIFGGAGPSCEIEATPIKYGEGTKLSFLTLSGLGAPVFAGDHEGGVAKPWDRIIRPSIWSHHLN